jgi:hypothetical protein
MIMTINCDNLWQLKVTIIAIRTEWEKKWHELILEWFISFIEDKVEKLLESANNILTTNWFELWKCEVVQIIIDKWWRTYWV